MIQQIHPQAVEPVLGRDQQRSPAVLAGLVDVRLRVQQHFDRLQISGACGEQQRRQTAPLLAAALRIRRGLREPRDGVLGLLFLELEALLGSRLRRGCIRLVRGLGVGSFGRRAAQAGAVDELLNPLAPRRRHVRQAPRLHRARTGADVRSFGNQESHRSAVGVGRRPHQRRGAP